ncbi:MAG: hypothetical protein P8Y97_05175 [Candidatus Lokiarchaeota archaeon]
MEPGTGEDHFYNVLDFVARIKPQGKCEMFQAMEHFVRRFQKRSLIFIISDLESRVEEISNSIKKLIPYDHSIIIINPFSPWFEIYEVDLSTTDKALAEAISEEMMEHILQVKQNIRKMGVNLITTGPDDILQRVLENYLEAKKKGKAY